MKKTIKALAYISAGFVLALITIFMINTTDEKQTELTQQMLQKFPAQEGFSLKEFKVPADERVSSLDFEKYSDYTKDPAKYDALIQNHEKALATLQKALSIGHVSTNPDETFYEAYFFYPANNHRLFHAFLSQKVTQGKTNEALKLLEQSNRFLASIAETPQTIIAKMLSITLLKRNAEFTKSLIDSGAIKKTPASLKESFNLVETPEQMWVESSRKEFQLISTVVLGPNDNNMENIFSGEESTKDKFMKATYNWLYPKLIRRNQTLNMISAGYAALSTPECLRPKPGECTYYEETTRFTLGNFFVNPAGRGLTKLLLPKFTTVRYKFQETTATLKDIVATL